jgi:hypothetical protein
MQQHQAIKYLPQLVNKDFLKIYQQYDNTILSGCGNISSKSFLIADFLREEKQKTLVWIVNDVTEKEIHKKMLDFWSNVPIFDFELKENPLSDREVTRLNNGKIINLISKSIVFSILTHSIITHSCISFFSSFLSIV